MPTTTVEIPDLSSEQLAALDDKMRRARQERDDRARAEQGQRQLVRGTRSKLTKVDAEITKVRADQDVKLGVIVTLHERLQGVEELNENDPEVRDERMALLQAITWATDEGVTLIAKVNVPSTARPYQLINDASPHGLNWRTPIAELGRRLEALTAERDRLQTRLDALGDGEAGEVAA